MLASGRKGSKKSQSADNFFFILLGAFASIPARDFCNCSTVGFGMRLPASSTTGKNAAATNSAPFNDVASVKGGDGAGGAGDGDGAGAGGVIGDDGLSGLPSEALWNGRVGEVGIPDDVEVPTDSGELAEARSPIPV